MMFSCLKSPPSLPALTVSTTPGSRSARMARGTHCLSDTALGGVRVETSHWSRSRAIQVLQLVGIVVLLRQLSYAIKTQLKAPIAPY